MSRKVIENLAVKYENVAKGVCRQMGGKVLNYEAKDILNRGRAEGEAEGIARMQRAAKQKELPGCSVRRNFCEWEKVFQM